MDQGTTDTASVSNDHPAAVDLQQFCSTDDLRPYLMKPFRFKGFTWATNGHILVRVREDKRYEPLAGKIDPAGPLKGFDKVTMWARVAVALPPQIEVQQCVACKGSGADHSADACSGDVCWTCDGAGFSDGERSTSVTLAHVPFALNYVRQMLALPNVEIAPTSVSNADHDYRPLYFRFNGGIGALMPLRKNYDTHIDIEPSKDPSIT